MTGLGGSFCDLCDLDRCGCHDLSNVGDMPINRTMEQGKAIYDLLDHKADGSVVTKTGTKVNIFIELF